MERIATNILDKIARETEDIGCIMVIEDALAKIYNTHQCDEELIVTLERAGAFLAELKERIRQRVIDHID